MLNVKRGLVVIYVLLLCCLLFLQPGSCLAAEKAYLVTETELSRLEENLNRLQKIAQESGIESEKQKRQLIILKNQLNEAENLLMKQQASLKTANELLKKYETEQKTIQRKIKSERTVWMAIAGVLLVHQLLR